MARSIVQAREGGVAEGWWAVARRQHWVVTYRQLLAAGLSRDAVRHRLQVGWLHRVWPEVYAVGRPDLSQHGRWMAAVLCCGPGAVLSHLSAALLWRLLDVEGTRSVDISVSPDVHPRHDGIVAHRRSVHLAVTEQAGIPVTDPLCTLIDLSLTVGERALRRAVDQADILGLISVPELRAGLEDEPSRPGVARLRDLLDREGLTVTESELERRFLALVARSGLSTPVTQARVNGFRVDFHWPQLGLVVETDGLRYHRTPAQQSRDRVRDQTHQTAGLTPLRFTHAQVTHEPERVIATLRAVAARRTQRAPLNP